MRFTANVLLLIVLLLPAHASDIESTTSEIPNEETVEIIKVPRGNRNEIQPEIPGGSKSRTHSTDSTFEAKYDKIRDLITQDKQLKKKIKKAAQAYEIDPIHIVGALVGEHTYNVDAMDRLQTYYVKAIAYFNSEIEFAYDDEKVSEFVEREQFSKCQELKDSYDLWACREEVWREQFRGEEVGGKSWPDERFGAVFFQPFYAGQTFGLGQLNPLTALRVSDMVHEISRKKKLSVDKANEVYRTIMDPDRSLLYMAAVLRISIDSYREIAHFDISDNPGITATLYNLGNVRNRAAKLKDANKLPTENYYGWLVNEKREELEEALK